MQYPYISGLADTSLQAELNDRLRQEMMVKMDAPKVMLDGDRCKNVPRKLGERYTRAARCKVHFAEESLVSISCLNYSEPGAYPQPEVHSITFDLTAGKLYQLTDLFKPNFNYRIRLAVAMRDAWWETGRSYVSIPFESLETQEPLDYYLQARCNEAFQSRWENSLLGSPEVCMVIPNLGSGTNRNYRMPVRLTEMKDQLDTSGTLKVLVDKID